MKTETKPALDLRTLKKGDHICISYDGEMKSRFHLGEGVVGSTKAYAGSVYLQVLDASAGYRVVGARLDEETGAIYADRGWEVALITEETTQEQLNELDKDFQEVYQLYHSGLITIIEAFGAVASLQNRYPWLNPAGLIDPKSGLRYPTKEEIAKIDSECSK